MSRTLPIMHRAFLVINRRLALPVLHAGLAPFWSLPITGYMAILRSRGRTSGLVREAPLGYVIWEGAVYVWAGFGPKTQWLRNIEADPRVEVVLPGRSFSGLAEVVTDPDERVRAGRALTAALGVIGVASLGVNPRTASDEEAVPPDGGPAPGEDPSHGDRGGATRPGRQGVDRLPSRGTRQAGERFATLAPTGQAAG